MTKRMASLTAFAGMFAQIINLVTGWPFAVAIADGAIRGAVLSLLIYGVSNIFQKQAAMKPFERNAWANIAVVSYAVVSLGWSIPGPIGVGLMQYPEDIQNQYAERITFEQALSGYQVELDEAALKGSYAEEVQAQCDEKVKSFEEKKRTGDPSYHNAHLEAYGPYDTVITPGYWDRLPVEALPLCPKASRLRSEAQAMKEGAEAALGEAKVAIQTKYGESFVAYLKAEQPTLYEAYFYPKSGRMRFRREELNELAALIENGEPGVQAMLWSAGMLSGVTSLASVLMTCALAVLPAVKVSWRSKTALKYQERLAEQQQLRRRDEQQHGGGGFHD
ncbi:MULTISPECIES: hypothetical protein [Cyanophyceae]|uniref:hypothetical protein n=1 Tax=Cyanophyceae TaxID=3028117 RepID=UPI00168464E4|nr:MULTISPECIES: hypothetical protein [Cyanophyceae]MBD1919450.1 hypothetical protein [Phormidium sp. FACHB-77]MBD2054302.1 hypothetical protein [Leptolyngbya sp. FACHB-60]